MLAPFDLIDAKHGFRNRQPLAPNRCVNRWFQNYSVVNLQTEFELERRCEDPKGLWETPVLDNIREGRLVATPDHQVWDPLPVLPSSRTPEWNFFRQILWISIPVHDNFFDQGDC